MENNVREMTERCSVFSKCVDVDLDFQENLMSYNDDLLKIIRCCINNFIVNTDYSNGVLTVYGKSKIFLTYVSDASSNITTADFEEDFQKSINIEGNYEDVSAEVLVINRYSNFRVINQRRIDIHNAFALDIRITACTPINMIDDAENTLIRRDTVNYLSLIGSAFARAEFEEETIIPADSDVVRKIINTFSSVHCEETKIIKNKMLVKATAEFSILYTTDTEHEVIRRCEKSVSISKIIDLNGIDEGDNAIVNMAVGNIYVKPKADKNNELRMIELIGDVNMNVSVFRKVTAQLTTDSYATDKEITNTFSKVRLNVNGEFISDVLSAKATFQFDNIKIVEVADLSLNICDGKNIELNAFIRNQNSELIYVSQRKEIEMKSFSASAVYVKSFDYVINSENEIGIRYLIEFNAVKFEERTFSVVSDIQVTENDIADSPALVVYFADENELLWDIAKKFRTSVDLIKAENELKEDVLNNKRILLIPGM
ncbi:MAG: DUF3794 domain-containing protein [Eubacterium sp.]|nr:DUF3794 domain-containing protein [Eubacterium sp.]